MQLTRSTDFTNVTNANKFQLHELRTIELKS